jgi:hypothetical protein
MKEDETYGPKIETKHMVKWMKRKSDPTRGFVKTLAAN